MDAERDRPAKRQRIGKACKSCRISKARCEVQPNADACHRCQVLDLECELPKRSSNRISVPAPSDSANDNDVETRLRRVEQLIAKLSEAVFPHSEATFSRVADNSKSP
ncbi:hypothetical protein KCU97_g19681, partial [Aureobasidium melanogenum]